MIANGHQKEVKATKSGIDHQGGSRGGVLGAYSLPPISILNFKFCVCFVNFDCIAGYTFYCDQLAMFILFF